MSLTVSKLEYLNMGSKNAVCANVAFDSSYAFGGESFAKANLGLGSLEKVFFLGGGGGYTFDYDYTNEKIKVFQPAPPIVFEEKHTAVGYTITLDYPAAWIVNVCQAGQNMQLVKRMGYASLSANQCCLVSAIADGDRTQIYTDGETDTVYVTYATQAWKELYALLVQEEAVTLATGANNLANKIMAFGYCHALTSGALAPCDIADTTADGEVGIKFNYATGALDANAAQDGETAVVTYLKVAASGFILDRFIADEDATKSGSDPYLNTLDRQLLLWLTTGYATFTGQTPCVIIEEDAAPATTEINTIWGFPGIAPTAAAPAGGQVWGLKDNISLTAAAYLFGYPWEIPNLVPLEVKNAEDLSGITALQVMGMGW